MKFTFLGTGTSHGVPAIDCMLNQYQNCRPGVCDGSSNDPKHIRTRCSALIETNGYHILIDTSQDFRQQMLRHKVPKLDAVLYTHSHADHIFGLPDIRSYTRDKKEIPLFGSQETIDALKNRFDYIFDPPEILGGGIPSISTQIIEHNQSFDLFGLTITPILVKHGSLNGCFGFQINDQIGYISDIKEIAEEDKLIFHNNEILILNCLRRTKEHVSHMILPETIALASELNPKKSFLVHMSHDFNYTEDQSLLPEYMQFAYDGLTITLP